MATVTPLNCRQGSEPRNGPTSAEAQRKRPPPNTSTGGADEFEISPTATRRRRPSSHCPRCEQRGSSRTHWPDRQPRGSRTRRIQDVQAKRLAPARLRADTTDRAAYSRPNTPAHHVTHMRQQFGLTLLGTPLEQPRADGRQRTAGTRNHTEHHARRTKTPPQQSPRGRASHAAAVKTSHHRRPASRPATLRALRGAWRPSPAYRNCSNPCFPDRHADGRSRRA